MQDKADLEALEAELADKEAMLADLEFGIVSLGGAFEDRVSGVRRRIVELKERIADYANRA